MQSNFINALLYSCPIILCFFTGGVPVCIIVASKNIDKPFI
jgi:hypothetical protein